MRVTAKSIKSTYKIELTSNEAELLMTLLEGINLSNIREALGNTTPTMLECDIHGLTRDIYLALHHPIEEGE